MNMLKTFFSELAKNTAKQPGWVPLVITYYFFYLYIHPENVTFLGFNPKEYVNLLVVVLAFFTYEIGDALDKVIWTKFRPKHSIVSKYEALEDLGIKSGSYRTSKNLLSAAEKYEGSWTQIFNEVAKFLRGFAVFMFALAIVPTVELSELWPLSKRVVAFLTVIPLLILSIRNKGLHITRLYENRENLVTEDGQKGQKEKKYAKHDLQLTPKEAIRLFFWDGVIVSTAKK